MKVLRIIDLGTEWIILLVERTIIDVKLQGLSVLRWFLT